MVGMAVGTKLSIDKAHCLLGHLHEEAMRKTAKHLCWVLTQGSMSPCKHCTKAKARQKNVAKESKVEKALHTGKCIYLDLSKVTVSKLDGSEFKINQKYWKIIVDECTRKKWCDFMETKIGMVKRTCEFLHLMKTRNVPIKCI